MSIFQGANGISIGQGTFNVVTGNQTNNNNIYNHYIAEEKKKRRIYDEFPDIQRGLVHRLKDLDYKNYFLCWNDRLNKQEVEFMVERTISTAKIHGDSSTYTVVSYKGQDAQKAWKKEFQQFSETTNTTKMQLFGINQSRIPLLIFYGELVPLAHLSDRLGPFGQAYTRTLSLNMECGESEMWINPAQGTLVHGLQLPEFSQTYSIVEIHGDQHELYLTHSSFSAVETLPPSVELLDEDVCFRYFSQLPLNKDLDIDVIDVFHLISDIQRERSPIINQPYVFSSKTNSIIAVGRDEWVGYGCLDNQVLMPDGRIRFTLGDKASVFVLKTNTQGDRRAWFSQASSVFHRLGISLDEASAYSEPASKNLKPS
ncbi:hypothetical protein E1B28_004976 [Marasmius oreades]|uniref:Uncharacterized protein n=1 Tax=Marasmius oreades TaxID=181124 RepID=A0A9P7UZN1_9AGAR|nr:uncharacterized protein E1B28_004976 [Marasmius oreades]KAG7097644.1 hypothetical protein E1B28_004976 [Marasmius oreades]